MLKYNYPWLAYVFDHWPFMVLLPVVLVVMAVLAYLTRWWDQKDEAAARTARQRPSTQTGMPNSLSGAPGSPSGAPR